MKITNKGWLLNVRNLAKGSFFLNWLIFIKPDIIKFKEIIKNYNILYKLVFIVWRTNYLTLGTLIIKMIGEK